MPIRIQLPPLHAGQQRALASSRRFNAVAGGVDSGKTTLAVDVLLTGRLGALRGYPVAFLSPDPDGLLKARRQILQIIEPAVQGRADRRRVELKIDGGRIDFYSLEDQFDGWDQYAVIVVDDAHMVDGLVDLWEDALRPLLSRHRGDGWIFGKPSGKRHQFWKLFERGFSDPDWSASSIPTWDNPMVDAERIEVARRDLPTDVFRQEYGAEFVDGVLEFRASQLQVGHRETFLQWCERLAETGLKVDGHPFRLDNRPAMRFIYELIPSTPEEAYGRIDVLMKCAQVGFTVMEMLAMIYMALKFAPAKIGMYLPDMKLAAAKSSERFMPIVRTIPDVYRMMVEDDSRGRRSGEGNVMIRNMGPSRFHFLWTSGKATTESFPMDVLSFDEVQEMSIADMEKTKERLSASSVRYTLMGSTANWPDRDIHYWYKKGTQHQFHTWCDACETEHILDEEFPQCIGYDSERRDYRYRCVSCGAWIDDPQRHAPFRPHGWVPKNPDAEHQKIRSIHFPQFLSPTITPREIIEAYHTADDMKNFYNRKLGKPYVDPSQVPITLELLNECAELGMKLGVVWKQRARGTFMGIDQMGQFNVVLIAERLETGHMALIHAEMIYSDDPFARCSELIDQYGVQVCVVESLPNYNDAKRFAARHPSRVFLAGYAEIKDDMLRWGDASRLDSSERRTAEEERDRWTVTLDQYKVMQVALSRIQKRQVVFPDPSGLVQEVRDKGIVETVPILKDVVFFHFTRTALVAEKDEEEKKYRRRVVKVGIDPHFSYAFMLLYVAWARAHGTASFLMPEADKMADRQEVVKNSMPGLPDQVVQLVQDLPAGNVCGRCSAFNEGRCEERNLIVRPTDAGCAFFDSADG